MTLRDLIDRCQVLGPELADIGHALESASSLDDVHGLRDQLAEIWTKLEGAVTDFELSAIRRLAQEDPDGWEMH